MANVKKNEVAGSELASNELANEVEVTAEGHEVEKEASSRRLTVERKPFITNGKECFEYFAMGKFRDKDVKISLVAPDRDKEGFDVLNMVAEDAVKIELAVIVTKTKERRTNRIRTFTSYEIWAIFEDGTVYKTSVIPNKRADEAKIDLILNQS